MAIVGVVHLNSGPVEDNFIVGMASGVMVSPQTFAGQLPLSRKGNYRKAPLRHQSVLFTSLQTSRGQQTTPRASFKPPNNPKEPNNDGETVPSTPADLYRLNGDRLQATRADANQGWSHLLDVDGFSDDTSLFILVFGASKAGDKGVYSLKSNHEGTDIDNILAFFTVDDATRYSTLLEPAMGKIPEVKRTTVGDLRYMLEEGGYGAKLLKSGQLIMPPQKTVEVTDWEKAQALRNGQWTVLDKDPEYPKDKDDALSSSHTSQDKSEGERLSVLLRTLQDKDREMLLRKFMNDEGPEIEPET